MRYTALLFDLDDTLLDFQRAEDIGLEQTYAAYFAPHCDKMNYKKTFQRINKALWEQVNEGEITPLEVKKQRFFQLVKELQVQVDSEQIAHHYEGIIGNEVVWFPETERALDHFKNKCKIGVITNGLTSVQERKYQLSGLQKWCDCFLISEKLGIAKPDRRIFDLAFTELAVLPHQTLMIGDSLTSDHRGALNAGIDFCWINPHQSPLPAGWPKPHYEAKSVAELISFDL